MRYLVNDILDFGQIGAGKFRKDLITFNIVEAINEIIMIQQEKADYNGIKLKVNIENFPLIPEARNQIISTSSKQNLLICTD